MVFTQLTIRNVAFDKLCSLLVNFKPESKQGKIEVEFSDNKELNKEKNKLFKRYLDLAAICFAIGVYFDKRVDNVSGEGVSDKYIPGGTITNSNLRSTMEYIFINAILNTKHVDLNEQERLKIAFSEDDNQFDTDEKKKNFSTASFIVGFINYGAEYLLNFIGDELFTLDLIALNMLNNLKEQMDSDSDIEMFGIDY